MIEYTLNLYGTTRRSAKAWRYLLESLPAGMTAAWADLTGFHVTAGLPKELPRTTHLWAWTAGTWLRLRVDHPHWWAAMLSADSTGHGNTWTAGPEEVTVHVHPLLPWVIPDKRIAQHRITSPDTLALPMIEFVPLRRTTASFVGAEETRPRPR